MIISVFISVFLLLFFCCLLIVVVVFFFLINSVLVSCMLNVHQFIARLLIYTSFPCPISPPIVHWHVCCKACDLLHFAVLFSGDVMLLCACHVQVQKTP